MPASTCPQPIMKMSGWPPCSGRLREVVGEVTDDLEVHVEPPAGRGVPRFTPAPIRGGWTTETVGVPARH